MVQHNTAFGEFFVTLIKQNYTNHLEQLSFLSKQYNNGASYSALNTLRPLINLIIIKVG